MRKYRKERMKKFYEDFFVFTIEKNKCVVIEIYRENLNLLLNTSEALEKLTLGWYRAFYKKFYYKEKKEEIKARKKFF